MKKYGTYKVYKNKTTGEILRVAYKDRSKASNDMKKVATNKADWEELDFDPENEGSASN